MLIDDEDITAHVDRHEAFRSAQGAALGEWHQYAYPTTLETLYILRSGGSMYPAFIYSPTFDKWWENQSAPGNRCTMHKEKLRPSNVTPERVTPQQMYTMYTKGLKGTVVSLLMWGE